MNPIALLPVTAADLDELAAIHAASFRDEPWPRDTLARLLKLPAIHGRVAIRDGRVAGFIFALIAGGEAEIVTLCVAPRIRRGGVARALLGDLYVAGLAAKATRLVLEVAADNPAALALYHSEGFTPAGSRPLYYHRRDTAPVDALILARKI